MCFCFDGESAVVAHRPDGCRERLPVASDPAFQTDTPGGKHAVRALSIRSSPAASKTKSVALTA